MRQWRRLLASLLLLVFAPSSVFAAMPLVWCVGSDGHRAVEYAALDSGRHAVHQPFAQPRLHDRDEAPRLHTSAESDCRDSALLDRAKVSSQQTHDGLLTFDARIVIVLPPLPLDDGLHVSPSSQQVSSATSGPPDPQRLALRSIVLRV